MSRIFDNKFVRFGIAGIIYLLWVIWVGNYWLLLGLPVVFDIYVTKKVNWAFWKKREGKNSTVVEWLDALIFAVIAVSLINIFLFQNYRIPTPSMEKSLLVGDHLFVSKVAYGPRMPNTPLAVPFTQNTMPLTHRRGKSWSDLVHWKYNRLAGFRDIKNDDIVVFNFPEGDTVVLEETSSSYYAIVRGAAESLLRQDLNLGYPVKSESEYFSLARKEIRAKGTIVYRPVDRRDNYVKRCVGIPGDTITITNGALYVNNKLQADNGNRQSSYYVKTNGTRINPKTFERMGIASYDQMEITPGSLYLLYLTRSNAEKISGFNIVSGVSEDIKRAGEYSSRIFPHNPAFPWNEDNFGPLWIPARGETVKLDLLNLSFYERIIDVYEGNDLEVKDSTIYINGTPADSYTFGMDYYWLMGDNRHNSADSRFWGFVPEDHVVGRPVFVWLSVNKEANGLRKIRFKRFLKRAGF